MANKHIKDFKSPSLLRVSIFEDTDEDINTQNRFCARLSLKDKNGIRNETTLLPEDDLYILSEVMSAAYKYICERREMNSET